MPTPPTQLNRNQRASVPRPVEIFRVSRTFSRSAMRSCTSNLFSNRSLHGIEVSRCVAERCISVSALELPRPIRISRNSFSSEQLCCIGQPLFAIKPHRVLDRDAHDDSSHANETNHATHIEQTILLAEKVNPRLPQDRQVPHRQ